MPSKRIAYPFLAGIVLGLVVVACGTSSTPIPIPSPTPTPSPARGVVVSAASGGTVQSDDARITLNIPPGGLSADTAIEIRRLADTAAPPNLPNAQLVGPTYELGPDGIEFDQAISVTLSLTADELPAPDEEGRLSLIIPWTTDTDGNMVLPNQAQIVYGGEGDLTLTTQLLHFSKFGSLGALGVVGVLPPSVGPLEVPTEFNVLGGMIWAAGQIIEVPFSVRFRFGADEQVVTGGQGSVEVNSLPLVTEVSAGGDLSVFEQTHTYKCARVGTGTYWMDFFVDSASVAEVLLGGLLKFPDEPVDSIPNHYETRVEGSAICVAPVPDVGEESAESVPTTPDETRTPTPHLHLHLRLSLCLRP